jgi:hypothetical protein
MKFQIFLEAKHPHQPIGEILRREGLFSTDLARIRQQVRDGALQWLRPSRAASPRQSAATLHGHRLRQRFPEVEAGQTATPLPGKRPAEDLRIGVDGS